MLSLLPKAVVIKTVISLGSVSSAGSPVPWFHGLQFRRLVLPLLSASRIVFLEGSCSNFNFVILFFFWRKYILHYIAQTFQPESVPYNNLDKKLLNFRSGR